MVYVRIMCTNQRVHIPSLNKDMIVEDIIKSIDLLNIIHYPYKLEYAGKILNDNVKILVSELNISEETTIILHNVWKNISASLNTEISALKNINEDIKKILDDKKIINNGVKKNLDNEKIITTDMTQKHASELTRLNNEIGSLKVINEQQNKTHMSEKEKLKSVIKENTMEAESRMSDYRAFIAQFSKYSTKKIPQTYY